MNFLPNKVEDRHLDEFIAICDGFIHEVKPEIIRPYVSKEFADSKLEEYTQVVSRPSKIPAFKEVLKETVVSNTSDSIRLFCFLTTVLGLRTLSPALTGTTKLLREMDDDEKARILLSWRNSPFETKNKIFSLILTLTVTTFQRIMPDLHAEAMRFPKTDARESLHEDYKRDDFEYTMMSPPVEENVELYVPHIDALIIGSGSGAGVVAHTLAKSGIKCLVLEKGKYYKNQEFVFDDKSGFKALYEGGGNIATTNAQTLLLAGATFGGGSTINWSACIKTPFKVRKEWYDNHGVEWVANESYDTDMDYVFQQMGASTECITHSHTNKVLLEGASKLGYPARPIHQNNGRHTNHSCGLCHLGCKWGIKQGSANHWFRDAASNGTEFMDQVLVQRILRNKRGLAVGVECTNLRNGKIFTIRGPKKYVVSSGSLQTPVLLQKSGFRNRNIGKHLKLHPISAIFGVWDDDTEPYNHSIMTSICSQTADLDGKAHGARIETLLHTPMLESAFFPWSSSDQLRQDMLKYQKTGAFILLARDTLSGTVSYDASKDDALLVDYTINKFDRYSIQQAMLAAADIIYVEGGKEIIHPYWKVRRFTSSKPKEERAITDKDYQEWRKHCENIPLSAFGLSYGSAHQMSTCRMSGKGPADGACDTTGRLYECENVFVADSSLLPTASGANPMITTMAFARHTALEIAKTHRTVRL